MRFINLNRILADPRAQGLIEAAEKLKADLAAEEDPAKRKKLMKAKRQAWVDFRDLFESIYGEKCWYTESKNPGTDDDIDHFRPKGRVVECKVHGGYWWLAFDWRNFRLSSHRANRPRRNQDAEATLGKADHFPLLEEGDRCFSPDDENKEKPALLDPTNPADPPHLIFDMDGYTKVAPAYEDSETAVQRVEASREILHLDWDPFVRGRRAIYAKVYELVLAGDRAEAATLREEAGAVERLTEIAAKLIEMTGEGEEYSRAAIAYIRSFKDRPWIETAVFRNIPDIA
ncbi:MAG TPA: hypothetical protein VFZ29_10515 [Solirubrobacterales bacterium]